MARRSELVAFRRSAPDELVGLTRELAQDRSGWVNLQARLPGDDPVAGPERPRAGVFALFRGRGPMVPVVTWVPGTADRGDAAVDSLGVQHNAGPRAVGQLAAAGVTVPAGWRTVGDHPGRGLVLELPGGTDPEAVLRWAFSACDVLSDIALPDTWVAAVERR